MKNLVVFISPRKKFYGEYALLVRVWIDNSLDLGWRSDDLLLITNFPFEYNGVEATVVGDEHFCESRPRSIKTSVVPHLIEDGIIQQDIFYWNHDLDAFQMNPFNLFLNVDLGLTDYGWKSRWCMGSYFFRSAARDFFSLASPVIKSNVEDETVFLQMEENNVNNFKDRHVRLNITYNFGMRRVEENWDRSNHPIKVVHFHPLTKQDRTWDVFVDGKNGLGHPIVNDRLKGVFLHHGFKRY